MNTIGYFEIHSSNPTREVKFYESVFGWKFFRDENIPIEYYRIETNSINGGLMKRPSASPPLGTSANTFVCSIQVENYNEIEKKILENGGQVALPKFAIPFRCYQGYYLDLDNNTFGIFEVNENAC